jgi:hypothetical protein
MSSPRGRGSSNRARRPFRGGGPRGRGAAPNSSPRVNRAPRDICNTYWSTGSCKNGFECRFRHDLNLNSHTSQSVSSTSATDSHVPDFFSAEGLAFNNNSLRNEHHNLKPSEAHNHLRPFLTDEFPFRSSAQVDGFVRIFASVNERNKSWVCLFHSMIHLCL